MFTHGLGDSSAAGRPLLSAPPEPLGPRKAAEVTCDSVGAFTPQAVTSRLLPPAPRVTCALAGLSASPRAPWGRGVGEGQVQLRIVPAGAPACDWWTRYGSIESHFSRVWSQCPLRGAAEALPHPGLPARSVCPGQQQGCLRGRPPVPGYCVAWVRRSSSRSPGSAGPAPRHGRCRSAPQARPSLGDIQWACSPLPVNLSRPLGALSFSAPTSLSLVTPADQASFPWDSSHGLSPVTLHGTCVGSQAPPS